MKWIAVIAMIVNGQLQYSELHNFPTLPACEAELERLFKKYQRDGFELKDINGGCYLTDWRA